MSRKVVDISHERYLVGLFGAIMLIDADLICPEEEFAVLAYLTPAAPDLL